MPKKTLPRSVFGSFLAQNAAHTFLFRVVHSQFSHTNCGDLMAHASQTPAARTIVIWLWQRRQSLRLFLWDGSRKPRSESMLGVCASENTVVLFEISVFDPAKYPKFVWFPELNAFEVDRQSVQSVLVSNIFWIAFVHDKRIKNPYDMFVWT